MLVAFLFILLTEYTILCVALPPEMREVSTQANFPEVEYQCTDVEDVDGNCFMNIKRMEDFIRESSAHAAKCGKPLVLIKRDMPASYVHQTWMCPCCGEKLHMKNCCMARTKVSADGAKFSRSQPEFNIRMLSAASLSGVNLQKLQEFLVGHFGVQIAREDNLRIQQTKVRRAIDESFEECKIENKEKAVAETRASENYIGDLEWTDENGVDHSTCRASLTMDGTGATRTYGHKHRGHSSAAVVSDRRTGLPLEIVVSRVSHLYQLCEVTYHHHISQHSSQFVSRHHVSIAHVQLTRGLER